MAWEPGWGDKAPFEPWEEVCVWRLVPSAPGGKEESRGEQGWQHPSPPSSGAQEAPAFPSRGVCVRHACVLLIRVFFFPSSWVFPPPPPP